MSQKLTSSFFNKNVLKIAPELLGCFLVRKINRKIEKYMITEVEAYDGEKDLACHASKGRTKRTGVMYREAGHIYVYLIYGIYYMLNIVTSAKDYPAAILIRGIDGSNGPGKLTKKLKINKSLNGKILGEETGLWIEGGNKDFKGKIKTTPRIGVNYAGPVWSKKNYRFLLEN